MTNHNSVQEVLSNTAEIEKTIEIGEEVTVSIGFDKAKLDTLTPEELVDNEGWEVKARQERVADLLDLYRRLPEQLDFKPGITAIFGDNGAGKTLLADTIIMAVKMQLYRQNHNVAPDEDLLSRDSHFYPGLPGRLSNDLGDNHVAEQGHARFVAGLASAMNVYGATLHDLDEEWSFGDAFRTPVALGNAAIGMSSRQSIEYLDKITQSRWKHGRPSVVLFDEPELGMSPRRQAGLIDELQSKAKNGEVALVPSNSIILFESLLPRIDLDEPERGVFTPEVE